MLHCTMPMIPRPIADRFRPEALFHPKSVAVFGADQPDGARILANLRSAGFQGTILADPDLTAGPDLAIACIDPVALFPRLAAAGTYAAIVPIAATGLRELARQTGVRSLGPCSFGVAVPGIGLNATTAHLTPGKGRIALLSQSAALCRAVLDWAEPNGVGFSHIVGIGDNDDIGFAIVLDWLSRDPGTAAILLDIRNIKDRRLFLSAARAAARLRPTVALRAGSLRLDPTGDACATFTAALRRCGVLSVHSLEDLLTAAETLTRARPARGEALTILSNARGPAQLAADAALRDGIAVGEIIAFSENSALDLARDAGGLLIVHAPAGPDDTAAIDAIIKAALAAKPPVLVCAMGETTGAGHRRRLADAGLPTFATPEQAVRGFAHLVQDRRNRAAARELPASTVLTVTPDHAEARRLFRRGGACKLLTQDDALTILAAYGVPTAPTRVVLTPEDAADAATALGYPVVLKRRRRHRPVAGRSDGHVLDLFDAAQVRGAARLLERHRADGDAPPGFLVQRQVSRARELRVRVADDPIFGPAIAFGQGGTASDLLHDFAFDLPPLNLPLARALVARPRVAATLGTLRDQPAANLDAIAEALVRISQLIVDFPEIAELDLNPLFADNAGVIAADAWIRLRGAADAPARLAIPPYPAELIGSYDARGELLTVRPIRPEDATAHAAFFKRLSPEDVRYRFFSALRELSADQIVRMTQIDYEREIAFVAVRPASGDTVGVARLVREGDGDTAEFAVVVQPDLKGKGLASHLMRRLIDWARAHGTREIQGQILADNQGMLAFIRSLGFTVRRNPGESDVMTASLII